MQKKKILSDMRALIQTIPTVGGGGGGGGSNCFSREVRTSFSSKKQLATYDFHGEVRTPPPSVSASDPINILGPRSPPISEFQTV